MKVYEDFNGCSWVGLPGGLYINNEKSCRVKAQTVYFRHEFILHEKDLTLKLSISALSRYRLYVNGESLLSGPCKGDRYRHYYETIDIGNYLKEGYNIIAIKVVAFPPYDASIGYDDGIGPQFQFGTAGGPSLLIGGKVINKDGVVLSDVGTGKAVWKGCPDDAIRWENDPISFWMGGMEHVDGSRLPADWISSQSPGGVWVESISRWPIEPNPTGGIYPVHICPRPIPLLYETPIGFIREMPLNNDDCKPIIFKDSKATIPPNTHVAVELDTGVLTTAYVRLPYSGGSGATITLRYAECYTGNTRYEKGDRADSVNYKLNGHKDTYLPSGKEGVYSPFWFRTFRFLRIEVQTGDEPLEIEIPKLIETGYPLEFKSTFVSSDDKLNKLWEISKRTLQMCMHETYEDCPYYEQLQYTMDTRLQILFTYALCGDTRMALRTIDDYHASILPEGILQSRYPCQETQVIPMFALHWIFMLEDYYDQTNDISIPRRYRATVDNVLDWFARHIDSTGLVGFMPYWQFTDWVEDWEVRHGTSLASTTGPSTSCNLFYVLALRSAARLNRLTGRNDAADVFDEDAAAILKAVEKQCLDSTAGLYREGPGIDEYGQHSQVLAVLTGLASKPKELMIKVMEKNDLLKCSFPWLFYLIRALEKVDLYDRATEIYDRLTSMIDLNITTIPERDYDIRSECHAWGAFPLYDFPRILLGVRLGAPGWSSIEIKPYFEIVNSCKGTVTTPVGEVDVAWENINGTIKVKGNVPENIPCTITLPGGKTFHLKTGGVFSYEIK